MQIYTLGHSTRTIEQLVSILEKYEIQALVDIRTVPRSRKNPQFNKDSLSTYLKQRGIDYSHMKSLGGLRHPSKDSKNLGWANESFRGYADHMQTEEFEHGIRDLLELASKACVAIMCAEALPWRCHRRMVGDALVVRGVEVTDILSENRAQNHELTEWAKVEGILVTYPKQI
ncbi:MAG: DUF488 domain-containing protein [Nitrososphaerota archaeon]|nr:DUF488 domain-containing protein [Nitrososphaerota archaeon]